MAANVCNVLHVGISVMDMERSLAWYEENIGFKKVKDEYAPPLGARICFIADPNGFEIELFQYDEPKPIPEERKMPNSDLQTVGTKHMAIRTDDMPALKERFVKNGVDIAHEVTMGTEAVMFVRDPDGVLIEFIQK
ncbi:MAG: VOC family protein [Eubacterium sp.]|nr:VOC family protein [Eubacterium sp.]